MQNRSPCKVFGPHWCKWLTPLLSQLSYLPNGNEAQMSNPPPVGMSMADLHADADSQRWASVDSYIPPL